MNEEVIYPSMVIRSQAEAIELLEKENKRLKMIIKEYERLNKINNRGFKITKLLIDFYKEILSKYKEIIGVSDDKTN